MEYKLYIYGISLLTTATITEFFKNIPDLLTLLLILMLTDILTGFLQALKHKNISTKKIYNGGIKKITILIIITISYFIDLYLITDPVTYIFNSTILYYVMLELISITKNSKKMGVKLPKVINDLIKNMSEKEG